MSEKGRLAPVKAYPGSPTLEPTVESLYTTVLALQEAVEILARQRGYVADSAITVNDLLSLGILPPDVESELLEQTKRNTR